MLALQRTQAMTYATLSESAFLCYLPSIMASYIRKLAIVVLAILAFTASNFAMVSGGLAHGTDSSGHHLSAGACEAAHDLSNSGHADDHSCAVTQEGMCGDGPTCCSSACQALILTSDFASFREKVELAEPLRLAGSFASTQILLERPPRA